METRIEKAIKKAYDSEQRAIENRMELWEDLLGKIKRRTVQIGIIGVTDDGGTAMVELKWGKRSLNVAVKCHKLYYFLK